MVLNLKSQDKFLQDDGYFQSDYIRTLIIVNLPFKIESSASNAIIRCTLNHKQICYMFHAVMNYSTWSNMILKYYCIQGNIHPVLFSPLSPSLPASKFKTERIPMSQTIFPYSQLCMGEFKMGQNRSQVEKGENNTGQK